MGIPLADALRYMTSAYVLERDIVLRCADRKMRNVVVEKAYAAPTPAKAASSSRHAPSVQPVKAVAGPSDYVKRLRNDPHAARDAFVYAEIFGKRLGDR